MPKFMIDCCAGMKGASSAMVERGWKVVTVDIELSFNPDIVADIHNWSWSGQQPDLMWFSPPCTEFSRESMPWSRTRKQPDLSIFIACKRIIAESQPHYWIIENVKGAIHYFGKPTAIYGPYCLWGFFPQLGKVRLHDVRKKESLSSSKAIERAKIPYQLSLAVALAVERSMTLFE